MVDVLRIKQLGKEKKREIERRIRRRNEMRTRGGAREGEKLWPKKDLEEREREVKELCRAAIAAIFTLQFKDFATN